MKKIGHYINGKFVDAKGETYQEVYNPATGEVSAQVAFGTAEEVEEAVESARNAFASWSSVTPLRRARVIFKFKALLDKNIDKLAELLTSEHGKILEDAKGEVLRAIELTEFSCGTPYLLKGSYSENVGTDVDSYTIRQPLGVCVGITPFNFPVMISAWMFVPAIACGNTFVLKPSEKDPSAALFLAELMQEAGLPAGVLNIINGNGATVDRLITHPKVAAVSAVGSTAAAEHIYQTAIAHGKRAHTFGGAKNHCVITPDADIDEAADAILGAAYGAAGERCMAVSVVVAITDTVGDALVQRLKEKIPQLQIAAGTESRADFGPLVTKEHLEKVKAYIHLGVEEGAELIVDGRDLETLKHKKGFFLGGCLFDHVKPSMRIYQEEIFGPVLCVTRVSNFEEALALINKNEYGNGVAIFTKSGEMARYFASKVSVGMVGINVPIPVPVAYHTFGGWKRSIFGDIHMHGAENVHFYTKQKTVTVRCWPKEKTTESAYHMQSH
ncbi:CoA-acylating methylmalonate-semialdehyde dehydrogenase [Coxiella burnetii]|uniref:CoA-acylating methylmalonate-semialdehyde dehydrogenase n=1 Tax=Coxiella burnetii TaxID=777 RepID=UPI000163A3E9|nr:CoA-acylating methylmalonate-semialdehyde dehydrogenase [Coxiella burnetii]ATN85778.1 methylmalonate-semialdehyde dehydrogenase [Coxiella burnetii str. Schperling]EDR36043.1 methylmalonate-semialdehyde dehydrogenase (acylating) [Coxiella burnetii Q321]OYK80287.1 methylmalonate-semialdehyde dehydrogenase (CoA acylating) [Coxiella burnetii]PHH58092.1 methylmalonate-semialdehyde dehydrogenase (CoA acylating) [Coxiella burnetii]